MHVWVGVRPLRRIPTRRIPNRRIPFRRNGKLRIERYLFYFLPRERCKEGVEISGLAMIVRKLEGLRDDKAGGADELVPRFLNKIKEEISFPLLLILNMVLDQE